MNKSAMKILCLDVGNTQIHGGVFDDQQLIAQFRYPTRPAPTSDQLGVFMIQVLQHYNIDTMQIDAVSFCSVVPTLDYSLRAAVVKYFNREPFILQPGVKTGLKIQYRNPLEVGADRIANAIATTTLYPNQHCLVFDFGTATTCCVLTADKRYLGGVIMSGMRLSMEALQQNTAKLSAVEIVKPDSIIGRSTAESIQSGLFYTQFATIKLLTEQIQQQYFAGCDAAKVIATGGFSHLFNDLDLFDVIHSDLVLQGLRIAYLKNTD